MRIPCDISVTEIKVPASVVAFCARNQAYLPEAEVKDAFIEAMRDISRWHQQRSPWYRALLKEQGTQVDAIRTLEDCIALPGVHANFFKQHEVLSIPESAISLHLTSSGTTGQKSQMFFDEFSITNARRMVDVVMQARGVVSEQPAHYLVNAYEPCEGLKVGTSNTKQHLMRYAPAAEVFWSLRTLGDGRHEFDAFGAVEALQRWADSGIPVRILGFPAFLHFTLQRLAQMQVAPLKLAQGSLVILGGGWKSHADKAISKEMLAESLEQQLGIGRENLIETFGSVEHSIPYVSCRRGHLHIPVWSQMLVRDVRSLAPLPDGEAGFLSFLSPYITSIPAQSVIMGDLAVRHPAASCDCGTPTAWFEVLGRAGTSTNKSCAAAAAELLPGGVG